LARIGGIHRPVPISSHTKIVGIFGDPVAHSRSPSMHNAAFAHLGLDYVYLAFHVRPADLRAAVAAIRALHLAGVNITVPHKEAVLSLLDVVSARARRLGAVNTIVNRGGRLLGDNTDVTGFVRSLAAAGVRPRGSRAVVVGAGGAAKGVIGALAEAGAARIWLVNRSAERARDMTRRFRKLGARIDTLPISDLGDPRRLRDTDLVVNATSLGWKGERFPPLAYAATPRACVFYDLVYGRETDFLRRARRAGRATLDGTEMLIQQGACAFRLWTGRPAPLAVMRAALQIR